MSNRIFKEALSPQVKPAQEHGQGSGPKRNCRGAPVSHPGEVTCYVAQWSQIGPNRVEAVSVSY